MRPPLAMAAACFGTLLCGDPAHAVVQVPGGFVNDVLLAGLHEPNSMAFLPDGRLLITEQRTGRVRFFVNGDLAASDPVLVVPDLNGIGYERGLQGVTVDPGWPARPYVYLYYTRTGGFCRIVRYTAAGDLSDPTGESLALADPLILMDDIPDEDSQHNGGCLRIGPGGYLFASLGDDAYPCGAADSTSLRGSLLRLDVSALPAGGGGPVPRALLAPPGNPLSTGDSNARLVWAYGFRNPWRFGIDPVTGATYLADVGLLSYDELNEVLPGDFLGWPYREGSEIFVHSQCLERGGSGTNAYKGPIVAVPHGPYLQAISTAGMYRPVPGASDNWPSSYTGFYGDVFYGEYFSGYLRRLKRLGGVWNTPLPVYGQPNSQDWATGLVAAVDFQVGPDGSLWWIAQFDSTLAGATGSLQRIRYAGLSVDVSGFDPPSAGFLASAPNPFAGATRVSFRLPARARVALAVFDLSGRRVRTLLEGEAPAGESGVAWDGRDGRGAALDPGVYFARLEREGETPQTVRVLRLR